MTNNPFAHLGYSDEFVARYGYPTWWDFDDLGWDHLQGKLTAAKRLGIRFKYLSEKEKWSFWLEKSPNVAFAESMAKTLAYALRNLPDFKKFPAKPLSPKRLFEHGIISFPWDNWPDPENSEGYDTFWVHGRPILFLKEDPSTERLKTFVESSVDWLDLPEETEDHLDALINL